jgi:hypothetical protein
MTGTPIAPLMILQPGVEIKTVEAHALDANRDGNEVGTYCPIEFRTGHAEIVRRVSQADQSWQ